MAAKVEVQITYTDKQLKELSKQIDEQLEKGIPVNDALKASGVPKDVYYDYKKRMKKKVDTMNAARAKRTGRKYEKYTLESFAPIFDKAEAMKKAGKKAPDVYKELQITPATYNRWKPRLLAHRAEEQEKARMARKAEKEAAKVEEAASAPKPIPMEYAPPMFTQIQNENKLLRDIIIKLTVEKELLEKKVASLGG